MIVTDVKWKNKGGDEKVGFYMDGYLAVNLQSVPWYLSKAWDCVGIISGHGKVRIGKSTLAAQVGYYIAWQLAGGRMHFDREEKRLFVVGMDKPKKEVHFNLQDNYVFSAEELQQRAIQLYEKYGKNQVIIYDEGRQGLDSQRAMESVNKGMQDFFQECGFMGHVILIVLPNYFKLHEDYAVSRSLFLLDCYVDKDYNRGYFNFYNEKQKEWLFYLGKKRIGASQKYGSARESFYGRFTSWLPFDKQEYENLKKLGLQRKQKNRREVKEKIMRDYLAWVLLRKYKIPAPDIFAETKERLGIKIDNQSIYDWVENAERMMKLVKEMELMEVKSINNTPLVDKIQAEQRVRPVMAT